MECNIVPLGEFGKNYMAYSGCYWCECADECKKVFDEDLNNANKKKLIEEKEK